VVRLPRALYVLPAALGLSGCLLFTDPVNKAPVVTFDQQLSSVYVGDSVDLTVHVADEDDPSALHVRWAEFPIEDNQGCEVITAAKWNDSRYVMTPYQSVGAPYDFSPTEPTVTCLCAQAVDHHGASGQGCLRITSEIPTPVASITDFGGKAIPAQAPKCARMQLSALTSRFVASDTIKFVWTLDYAGTDPRGSQIPLTDCPGTAPSKPGAYRCFTAIAPGVYTIGLYITDTPPAGTAASASSDKTSETVQTVVRIGEDAPACIQQASPDPSARLILLGRGTGPDGTYEARTFSVTSVGDDCEPYPPRTDAGVAQQLAFIWSVMDGTQGKTDWQPQANSSTPNAFTVDHQNFPNARPGDTIGVRVEVRDTPTQALYSTVGPACADASTTVCCGAGGCSSSSCVRWTTWTVQFQP
jgi:hypothetical protein